MSEVYPVQAFTMLCQWCLVSAAYGDQLADDYADRDRVAAQLRRLCELVGDVPTEAGWRSQVFRPELGFVK